MKRDDFGVWQVIVPAKDGLPAIPHGTKVKVSIYLPQANLVH
jgi:1,4-alpha-glucan branching enzyme